MIDVLEFNIPSNEIWTSFSLRYYVCHREAHTSLFLYSCDWIRQANMLSQTTNMIVFQHEILQIFSFIVWISMTLYSL